MLFEVLFFDCFSLLTRLRRPGAPFDRPAGSFDRPGAPFDRPAGSFDRPGAPFERAVGPVGNPGGPFARVFNRIAERLDGVTELSSSLSLKLSAFAFTAASDFRTDAILDLL